MINITIDLDGIDKTMQTMTVGNSNDLLTVMKHLFDIESEVDEDEGIET